MTVLMRDTSESRRVLNERCPESFYLRYVEKLTESETDVKERGKVTHLALKNLVDEMLKRNKTISSTAREVKSFVVEAGQGNLTPVLHAKGVIDDLSSMVRYGLLGFDIADYDVVETEKEMVLTIDEEGHRLKVKIDLFLVRKDGVAVIGDFKTGSPYPAEGDLQLATYALAAWTLGFKEIQCFFKFLKDKQTYITAFSDDYLDYVLDMHRQHCQDVEKRLAIGKQAFPAKPSWFCDWCSYPGCCSKRNIKLQLPAVAEGLSQEELKVLGEAVLVAESLLSKAKALLKQKAEESGYVEVNGEYFASFRSESDEYDPKAVFDVLAGNGVIDFSVYNINKYNLYRHAKAPYWPEIEALAQPVARRNFGHKPQPPELPAVLKVQVA